MHATKDWGRDVTRAVAAAVLLLAFAAFLGHSLAYVDIALSATVGDRHRLSVFEQRQFECMERSIRRTVPAGVAVAVDPSLADPLWTQRLVELAYPWARIAPTPTEADYLLSIEPASVDVECHGVRLAVHHRS